jgi:small subunit ribosomal protein S11
VVKAKKFKTRKKVIRNVLEGIVHILATFNNTIVSITDKTGNVVSWASCGSAHESHSPSDA